MFLYVCMYICMYIQIHLCQQHPAHSPNVDRINIHQAPDLHLIYLLVIYVFLSISFQYEYTCFIWRYTNISILLHCKILIESNICPWVSSLAAPLHTVSCYDDRYMTGPYTLLSSQRGQAGLCSVVLLCDMSFWCLSSVLQSISCLLSVFPVSLQCLHRFFPVSFQFLSSVYAVYFMSPFCLSSVISVSFHCLSSVFTMLIQCLSRSFSSFLQCLSSFYPVVSFQFF